MLTYADIKFTSIRKGGVTSICFKAFSPRILGTLCMAVYHGRRLDALHPRHLESLGALISPLSRGDFLDGGSPDLPAASLACSGVQFLKSGHGSLGLR